MYINDFVIAFVNGWILDIVLLTFVPCIVIVGGFMIILMANMSTLIRDAYKEFQSVFDQKMRTIKIV